MLVCRWFHKVVVAGLSVLAHSSVNKVEVASSVVLWQTISPFDRFCSLYWIFCNKICCPWLDTMCRCVYPSQTNNVEWLCNCNQQWSWGNMELLSTRMLPAPLIPHFVGEMTELHWSRIHSSEHDSSSSRCCLGGEEWQRERRLFKDGQQRPFILVFFGWHF